MRKDPWFIVRHGDKNPSWRGDAARTETKRARAQRMYPLAGVLCARCPAPARDRHHKDGDTGNNAKDNIEFLCRRCHMLEDGRLERLAASTEPFRKPQSPKPCRVCAVPSKPLRRGRCHACNEYYRRNGAERPPLETAALARRRAVRRRQNQQAANV